MRKLLRYKNFLVLLVTFATIFVVQVKSADAAACPAADGDDGSTDGVITISSNSTWTVGDATAFDCSSLDLLITNNSTLTIDQNHTSGYMGQVNLSDLTVNAGSSISVNAQGCSSSTSPNLSTNICADGGTSEGTDANAAAGGAGASGTGGTSSNSVAGGTYILEDIFAPNTFGAGGGRETGANLLGGSGGGALRLNLSGNLTNNGTISANAGSGAVSAVDRGAGGGGGGSIYITVSGNLVSATGVYEAKGGDGGDSPSGSDGGGGGGGFIYVEYATSSIATTDFPTYTNMSGGAGPGDADDGSSGSAVFKDTTSSTFYFVEGISRLPMDSSVCSSNVCSLANIVVENGGEGRMMSNTASGTYITVSVSGNVNVKAGGKLTSDIQGCASSTSPSLSTNICADGGTSEGADAAGGAGGGGASGTGGVSSNSNAGGTYVLEDILAPNIFGAGGGLETGASLLGGAGGGILRMNITGNLTNNGIISANGGAGAVSAVDRGAGGGAGGSIYITVSGNIVSATGVYESKGGDGGDSPSGSDGGGGGGGFIYVEYATSSIATTDFPTYTNMSGGAGPGAADDGSNGSAVFKDTTSSTFYFVEGISRLPTDSSICSSNTCSFGHIVVENGAEGRMMTSTAAGTYITMSVSGNVNVKAGGKLTSDIQGCASSTSPSLTTNICADGGTGEGADGNAGAGGAGASGTGGTSSISVAGGTYVLEDIFAPNIFGSGGGRETGTNLLGGYGGGVLRMNITGNLTNNGIISANAGSGVISTDRGSGGGAGGSIYLAVSGNLVSATGVYESKGGDGGDSPTGSDGGGGGGGFIYVQFASTSISSTDFPTYADVTGGTGPGAATDGNLGSAIFKNTTSSTFYFVEGISRLPMDSSVCSSGTCSLANIVVENGGEGRMMTNTSAGTFIRLEVSGDVNVKAGGKLTSDYQGCPSSKSANSSTNICADGGSSEGGDGNAAAGGGAYGGVGGTSSAGVGGGTVTYGNSTAPVFFGSGGGLETALSIAGGPGGGVLQMNISGTLTQNGTISANGEDGFVNGDRGSGGGAGGSVYISAATLAGSSTSVYALGGAGGDSSGSDGGGGGGGRICIAYTTNSGSWLSSLSATSNTSGGVGPGAAADGGIGSLDTSTCTSLNSVATVSSISASQRTDGTGIVDVSVTVDDADDDDLLLQVKYDIGGGDVDATLGTSVSSTFGTLSVDNAQSFQIGATGNDIPTGSGANTLSFTWTSQTDIPSTSLSTTTLAFIAYDGTANSSTYDSSGFVVDNLAPSSVQDLTYNSSSAASSETISGTTEADAIVLSNGSQVTTAASDGSFSFSVPLISGTNTFAVTVKDAKGNVSGTSYAYITTPGGGGSGGAGSGGSSGGDSGSDSGGDTGTGDTGTGDTGTGDTGTGDSGAGEGMAGESETPTSPDEGTGTDTSSDSSGGTSSGGTSGGTSVGSTDVGTTSGGTGGGGLFETVFGGGSGGSSSKKTIPLQDQIAPTETSLFQTKFATVRATGRLNGFDVAGVPQILVDKFFTGTNDYIPFADSDSDGVTDQQELQFGLDPFAEDSDTDTLADAEELLEGSNAASWDTDKDGISDASEEPGQEEIFNAFSVSEEELEEYLETFAILIPEGETINTIDSDNDGLADKYELGIDTNPQSSDTDADSYSDSEEILFFDTDPTIASRPTGLRLANVPLDTVIPEGPLFVTGAFEEADQEIGLYILAEETESETEEPEVVRVGGTTTDDIGKFAITSEVLAAGEYTALVAAEKGKKALDISYPFELTVTAEDAVERPIPKRINGLLIKGNTTLVTSWKTLIFGTSNVDDVLRREGSQFMVGSTSEALATVEIRSVDENGVETVLGEVVSDASGKFLFLSDVLSPGDYLFYAYVHGEEEIVDSSLPLIVKVQEEEEDTATVLSIGEDGLLRFAFERPVLEGIAVSGTTIVVAVWESLILNNVIVNDTTAENFALEPTDALEPGTHKVTLYALNQETGERSTPSQVQFEILGAAAVTPSLMDRVSPVAVGAGASLVLLVLVGLFALRRKKGRKA